MQSVFAVRGEEAVRLEVATGIRNGDFVEILGGLDAGDRIIISDTEELERVSSFKLTE
jgi:HlyD family secretion protein